MSSELKVEVVDRYSTGVTGAQVVVQQRSGPARSGARGERTAETNFNGLAVFSLDAGSYRVRTTKPGYRAEPSEAELRLTARDGQASPAALKVMLLPLIGRQDLAEDSVGYEHIGAKEVHGYQLGEDAVEYEHIAGNAVTGYQIADKAVTGDHIADGAIAARHLAPGAVPSTPAPPPPAPAPPAPPAIKIPAPKPVGSKMILDGAVTSAKIGPAAIGANHLSPALQHATAPVAGRVIVATEGGDHPTVGRAVAALRAASKRSAGADADQPVVIDVMPGVYEEPSGIRLPPQVSLRGAGRECTELRFARGGLTVADGNELAISALSILSPKVALRITSSAVRVDDCFLSAGDTAISAEASTLVARGNLLRKGARGIRALGCALRLQSNELEQLTACALELRQSHARVLHNTFLDNARDLDVRDMQGGRRCLVAYNILRDIVADPYARRRIFDAHNLTPAAAPLEPWEDL